MNFHTFVLIATVSVYILLLIYKRKFSTDKKSKRSNLIYVLIVPCILYLYNFIYGKESVNISQLQDKASDMNIITGGSIFDDVSTEPLLTSPFPETSVSIPLSSSS
jgi:ABC-type uncharacterized transport system YnjBCD permease subunit